MILKTVKKIIKVQKDKILILTAVLFLVTSCVRPDITIPKSKYNAESLSKDWRSNMNETKKRQSPYTQPYTQPYAYPVDNDAEYIPPKQGYIYVPQQPPTQYYVPGQQQYVAPYTQDNDAQYGTRYPTPDPDADNSGYYYLNQDKKLPPPRKVDPYSAEQYDYPIYFD